MAKFIFFINFLLLVKVSFAQNCNCETNLLWVKKTFEENDAGFQYALDVKGREAYEVHNKVFLQKAKIVNNQSICSELLFEWLTFFRKGHIDVRLLESNNQEQKEISSDNWERIDFNTSEFEKYLNNKMDLGYEGIWETGAYKIGIKKIANSYVGFVIETSAENWKVGEVKIRIEDKTGTFYLRDRSAEQFKETKAMGINYLQLGRFTLKRLFPKFDGNASFDNYFKLISATKPYLEEVNPTTLLLRIPSFSETHQRDIDSVIIANKSRILKTENLIIDLRNNGGGSDRSYKEIIPLLYTNPIREVGVELLSTKLNNQRMLDFINKPEWGFDEEGKKWAKASFDTLQRHLGSFVNLDTTKISTQILDTIYTFPKNVGIIIHKGNGSTTEQFLLAAKQSKKVKLFGTTTFGVLDISNMNFVKSPCGEFELGYCLSKSFRIPDMTIDGKGIQPDYFLDNEIEDVFWLDYVTKILNGK